MTSTTSRADASIVTVSLTVRETAGERTSLAADTASVAVQTLAGQADSPGDLGVAFWTDAFATGQDTYASLDAAILVEDAGLYASVLAAVATSASAQGADPTFATATSGLDLVGSADRVVRVAVTVTSVRESSSGSSSAAHSSGSLFALDIRDCAGTPATGEAAPEPVAAAADASGPVGEGWTVDGNLAVFHVDLVAIGADTLATVDVTAFTAEDLLSLVASSGIAIA